MQLEQTLSIELQTSPALQYEKCEFCCRNFFKGKLKYHLKLCTLDNPMSISPKKSPLRIKEKNQGQQKGSILIGKEQKVCQKCHAKLPPLLYEKHISRCHPQQQSEAGVQVPLSKIPAKASTEVNFKQKTNSTLPLIKRSARQCREILPKQPYQVKLRQELSCFRRAQDIKQVQCPACQRIFSKEASLRHVPICQTIREKERMSIALKRKGNRSVGEQHTQRRVYKPFHQDSPQGRGSRSVLEINPQQLSFPN